MNLLHAYFKSQLVAAGFPDNIDIQWSLNYCQGDGIAFYGDITYSYWLKLFAHIYPNQKRKYRQFERLTRAIIDWENSWDTLISIERNAFGHHYSHFNTMALNVPKAEDFRFFYDHRAKKEWYFSATKVYQYQALWDDFIIDLQEYIRALSRRLEREGYAIIEATPYEERIAYQFQTAHYSVELMTKPVDFSYFFLYEDEAEMNQLCQDFINGKSQCAEIYAVVRDRRTDIALGESDWINLVYDKGDRQFSGYKSELICEAIEHAKQNIQQYSQTFAKIRPLAV